MWASYVRHVYRLGTGTVPYSLSLSKLKRQLFCLVPKRQEPHQKSFAAFLNIANTFSVQDSLVRLHFNELASIRPDLYGTRYVPYVFVYILAEFLNGLYHTSEKTFLKSMFAISTNIC